MPMEVTRSFSVIDHSINNGSESLSLSVRISSDTFDFCVLDISQKMVVALESWNIHYKDSMGGATEAAEKIRESSPLLAHVFYNIIIVPDNSYYALIPEKLFEAEEAKIYPEFIYEFGQGESVLTDSIFKHNIKNTYWLSYELMKAKNKIFPDAFFLHSSSVLIKSSLAEIREDAKVFVNFSGRRMDVLVTRNSALLFVNSFDFLSIKDIAYYLMNVYKQLGLEVSTVPVQLSGDIENGSAAYEIIYKYVKNVSFAGRPSSFTFCEGLNGLPQHLHFVLFNSFLCE